MNVKHQDYPTLLSPWTVRGAELRNRVVFPPTCPTDRAARRARAPGRAGAEPGRHRGSGSSRSPAAWGAGTRLTPPRPRWLTSARTGRPSRGSSRRPGCGPLRSSTRATTTRWCRTARTSTARPYSSDPDFELELGFVVCRDLRDPTRGEARAAIGGFVILNDVSLRDVQWEEIHSSALGPVVKCKSFATAMSSEVVTADEFLDDLSSVTGQVLVDGERWATGRADDFVHPPEACVERAAAGESLLAGDLFSTGTFAGCSGIELGRLPRPGARVTLDVDRIGTLTNQLGEAP